MIRKLNKKDSEKSGYYIKMTDDEEIENYKVELKL